LSFATAINLLSRSGATVIAEQLTPIEMMAQDSVVDHRQDEFDRISQAFMVHGGLNADPTEAEAEAFQALVNIFAMPVRPLVSLKLVRKTEICVAHPYALVLDIPSSKIYFLGLKATETPDLVFHQLSALERVDILGRPSILPRRDSEPWEQLLKRAATYQMGGHVSLDEPFTVQLCIPDATLKRQWIDSPPCLPDFDLEGQNIPMTGNLFAPPRAPIFTANQVDGTAEWVLGFGGRVEVVHPPILREKVRALAQVLAQAH
jgi:hypothetical protein